MTQKESRTKKFLEGDLSSALLLLSALLYLTSGLKATNTLLEEQSIPKDWFMWASASVATALLLSIVIIFLIFSRMDKRDAMREIQSAHTEALWIQAQYERYLNRLQVARQRASNRQIYREARKYINK